jgi:hypothetical protein
MRNFASLAAFIITAISLTAAAPAPVAELNARQVLDVASPGVTLDRKSKIASIAAANKPEPVAAANAASDAAAEDPELLSNEKRQFPGGFPGFKFGAGGGFPGFGGSPAKGAAPKIPGLGGAGGGFPGMPGMPGFPGKGAPAAHPSASAAASATRAATPAPSAGAKRQLTAALLSNGPGGLLGDLPGLR